MVTAMIRYRLWLPYLLISLILAGCAGSGAGVVRSATQTRAATQLERGIRAQNKGDINLAEKYLADSLRISSSIEDNPARVTALVNLARLNRLNHKLESAANHIEQALKLSTDLPVLIAETTYEKALIELERKHFGEALDWATKLMTSDTGKPKGRHLNLLARILKASGDLDKASFLAIRAREENRQNGESAEEANSLRIMGSIERANGRFGEAGKHLLEALEIDKQIGESHKIALDLEELAALSGDQGNMKMMVNYLERAFSVHLNGGHTDKAAANQLNISEIYRNTGNMLMADKALLIANQLMRKEISFQNSSSESASPSSKP